MTTYLVFILWIIKSKLFENRPERMNFYSSSPHCESRWHIKSTGWIERSNRFPLLTQTVIKEISSKNKHNYQLISAVCSERSELSFSSCCQSFCLFSSSFNHRLRWDGEKMKQWFSSNYNSWWSAEPHMPHRSSWESWVLPTFLFVSFYIVSASWSVTVVLLLSHSEILNISIPKSSSPCDWQSSTDSYGQFIQIIHSKLQCHEKSLRLLLYPPCWVQTFHGQCQFNQNLNLVRPKEVILVWLKLNHSLVSLLCENTF